MKSQHVSIVSVVAMEGANLREVVIMTAKELIMKIASTTAVVVIIASGEYCLWH
jgi:hypothetical protein